MVYRRDYRRGVKRKSLSNFRRDSFFQRRSVTELIIIFNVVLFFPFFFLLAFSGKNFLPFIALQPKLFLEGYVWTIIVSMFMHGGFGHLFVNMVSMFFIGNFVERLIGRKRFIWFYFISGVSAGLFFVGFAYLGQFVSWGEAFFGGMDSFAVGASGALFGLGGLLAVLIPRLRVLVFFIIPMPMWAAMTVLMFVLWGVSGAAGLPIGNTAHFGGLVVGIIYGFYLRGKYARKIKALNRVFG